MTDLLTFDVQSFLEWANCSSRDTQSFIEYTHIEETVGARWMIISTEFLAPDIEGFDEASQTLLQSLLLEVIQPHQEIAVAGLKWLCSIELFDPCHIPDIDRLTLHIVASRVIECSYSCQGRKHPFKVSKGRCARESWTVP